MNILQEASDKLQFLLDYGIIAIDKPSNLTSHKVSEIAGKMLNVSKAGHSGTLDPKVTGVLPVALGKATRIMEFLLRSDKTYVCLMHLHGELMVSDVKKVLKKFVGKIEQLPPVKSAVKRALRTREIYSIKLLDHSEKDYLIEVRCQAGTYIRKLVHDIGQSLEVGAHMQELRRIKSSMFTEKDIVTLQDLDDAVDAANKGDESALLKMIFPMSYCFKEWDIVKIEKKDLSKVLNGMMIPYTNNFKSEVALFYKNKMIGIGKNISNKYIRPFRIYFDNKNVEKYLK